MSCETKTCTKCLETKPVADFHKSKRSSDGFGSYCKTCNASFNLLYNRANPEKVRGFQRLIGSRYSKVKGTEGHAKKKNGHFVYDQSVPVITIQQYEVLLSQPCHSCGGLLNGTAKGLDRIDNSKGYSADNVLPCCANCNTARNALPLPKFFEHVEKIYNYQKLKKAPPLLKPPNAFEKDLAFGNCAEAYLVQSAPEKFELLDGRKGDIKLKQSGEILEVKTERRSDETTPNIFVERISNKNKQTRGGPWAAIDNGCKYIAYLFWPTKRTYVYPAKDLTEFLEQQNYKPFEVFVAGSKAIGLIVPRAHIAHLEIKLEDIA